MNKYIMPIHTKHGCAVVTPDGYALKQRCARLKRELRKNTKLITRTGEE